LGLATEARNGLPRDLTINTAGGKLRRERQRAARAGSPADMAFGKTTVVQIAELDQARHRGLNLGLVVAPAPQFAPKLDP
jgi:hypothetical protein